MEIVITYPSLMRATVSIEALSKSKEKCKQIVQNGSHFYTPNGCV